MHHSKKWLVFLATISIFVFSASCGKTGARIRACSPVSADKTCVGYDQRKKKDWNKTLDETDGFKCKHAEEFRLYLVACRDKKCANNLKQTVCTSRPQNGGMKCERPDGSKFLQPFDEKGDEYVCTPEVDYNTAWSYCKKRC